MLHVPTDIWTHIVQALGDRLLTNTRFDSIHFFSNSHIAQIEFLYFLPMFWHTRTFAQYLGVDAAVKRAAGTRHNTPNAKTLYEQLRLTKACHAVPH